MQTGVKCYPYVKNRKNWCVSWWKTICNILLVGTKISPIWHWK